MDMHFAPQSNHLYGPEKPLTSHKGVVSGKTIYVKEFKHTDEFKLNERYEETAL